MKINLSNLKNKNESCIKGSLIKSPASYTVMEDLNADSPANIKMGDPVRALRDNTLFKQLTF